MHAFSTAQGNLGLAGLAIVASCGLFLAAHLASVIIAAARWRNTAIAKKERYSSIPVTILRPVCGLENFIEETLSSTFRLDHRRYEIVFCVARGSDPVVPLVERLIAANPHVPSRLLIGDERIGSNPKLNNLVKGWEQARYEWIAMADSNVLMPSDYLEHLLAAWQADTGLVCSPPFASRAEGLWAELESVFLNNYQARYQYFADTLGLGFAQGKTMLWRRHDLENWGGIRALAAEPAEDAAATKLVRSFGARVRLVNRPFEQPLGSRSFLAVWNRQLRWARLRRATFPLLYALEIFSPGVVPLVSAALAGPVLGVSALSTAAVFLVLVYAAEAALAWTSGSPLRLRSPVLWVGRDVLLVGLWTCGWFGRSFTWRGEEPHPLKDAGARMARSGLQAVRRG